MPDGPPITQTSPITLTSLYVEMRDAGLAPARPGEARALSLRARLADGTEIADAAALVRRFLRDLFNAYDAAVPLTKSERALVSGLVEMAALGTETLSAVRDVDTIYRKPDKEAVSLQMMVQRPMVLRFAMLGLTVLFLQLGLAFLPSGSFFVTLAAWLVVGIALVEVANGVRAMPNSLGAWMRERMKSVFPGADRAPGREDGLIVAGRRFLIDFEQLDVRLTRLLTEADRILERHRAREAQAEAPYQPPEDLLKLFQDLWYAHDRDRGAQALGAIHARLDNAMASCGVTAVGYGGPQDDQKFDMTDSLNSKSETLRPALLDRVRPEIVYMKGEATRT
ncbi:MAG: hypothetical protein ACFB6R_09630 [Alphaproteobacteria bacterium]